MKFDLIYFIFISKNHPLFHNSDKGDEYYLKLNLMKQEIEMLNDSYNDSESKAFPKMMSPFDCRTPQSRIS